MLVSASRGLSASTTLGIKTIQDKLRPTVSSQVINSRTINSHDGRGQAFSLY